MHKALFVAFEKSLAPSRGGQQVCTSEFLQVIKRSGYKLFVVSIPNYLSPPQRVINKISPLTYPKRWPFWALKKIVSEARHNKVDTIFFNLIDFLPLGEDIRKLLGSQVRLVLLSHGLASIDSLHINRIANEMPEIIRMCPIYNTFDLIAKEMRYLKVFDEVVSISNHETEICKWLGAIKNIYLPRIIDYRPLIWNPIQGRVGIVGTLDHPPSMEGIIQVLEKIPSEHGKQVEVRVVSQSKWHGAWLARRYSFVKFLDSYNDEQVKKEASTWCAFLNPIFCFARGCSTKLATGLSWGLPCISTPSGVRGYELPSESVILANGPNEFAHEIVKISKIKNAENQKKILQKAALKFMKPDKIVELFRLSSAISNN